MENTKGVEAEDIVEATPLELEAPTHHRKEDDEGVAAEDAIKGENPIQKTLKHEDIVKQVSFEYLF